MIRGSHTAVGLLLALAVFASSALANGGWPCADGGMAAQQCCPAMAAAAHHDCCERAETVAAACCPSPTTAVTSAAGAAATGPTATIALRERPGTEAKPMLVVRSLAAALAHATRRHNLGLFTLFGAWLN